jgi:hypothetical protein
MSKTSSKERFIQLTLQRKVNDRFLTISTRSYLHAHTAIVKAVELLMFGGRPNDVVEVAHKETGNQLGTVKITATGQIKINVDEHHPMLLAHTSEVDEALRKGHRKEQARRDALNANIPTKDKK